jgi:Ni/Co efflux regulator RcnB
MVIGSIIEIVSPVPINVTHVCTFTRTERERERERERDRDRDRDRDRETERETQRDRGTERDRERACTMFSILYLKTKNHTKLLAISEAKRKAQSRVSLKGLQI